LNICINQGFGVPSLNTEFVLPVEFGCRKQDIFNKCNDAVVLNRSWNGLRFADFFGDCFRRVEKVDFAVCSTSEVWYYVLGLRLG
jgi:hypothetical protein